MELNYDICGMGNSAIRNYNEMVMCLGRPLGCYDLVLGIRG